jgi:benzoylformate decarboxylase
VNGAPGLDLPKLDVAAVAEGYGVKAHRAKERDGVAAALRTAFASSQPELVEVPVAPGMSLF